MRHFFYEYGRKLHLQWTFLVNMLAFQIGVSEGWPKGALVRNKFYYKYIYFCYKLYMCTWSFIRNGKNFSSLIRRLIIFQTNVNG